MITDLLNRISAQGVIIDVAAGKLKLLSENGAIDAALLDEIRERKEELAAYLSRHKKAAERTWQYIPVAAPAADYAVSNGQRRLWVLSRFEESNALYNLPFTMLLEGRREYLAEAIRAVVGRHEVLRTVFLLNESGELRQRILDPADVDLQVEHIDLRSFNDRQDMAAAHVRERTLQPFDLERGPLLRTGILQLTDETYLFYYILHHIICDGWSLEVLKKDVTAYYHALVAGTAAQLPQLRLQYKDYAVWQNGRLLSGAFQQSKAYWTEKLSGELPRLELPAANARPAIKTYTGKKISLLISPAETAAFKKLCAGLQGSLFTGLLAAWNILFFKYTALKDIIIGTAVSGRDHPGLEDQIGFYINLLATRNRIDPEESFLSFFHRLKASVLADLANMDYPFDQLVEELQLPRDVSRHPIFDIFLVHQNAGGKLNVDRSSAGIILEEGIASPKYDLDIECAETWDSLYIQLSYNTDVYSGQLIRSLLKHFARLLSVLPAHAEKKIGQLDILDEQERHQVLHVFNQSPVPLDEQDTLVHLFKRQAERYPERTALVAAGKHFSYRQLDEMSDRIAACLVQLHAVRPGERVALLLSRNEWLIFSILGILKAGGAYVPVDPAFPQQRIDRILGDSGCRIIWDEATLSGFMEWSAGPVDSGSLPQTLPGQLAYVMYTSGSTGHPKGMMITHANVVSFFRNLETELGLDRADSFALTTNITFDISVLELLGTLCTGKIAHLFTVEELSDPELLFRRLEQDRIGGIQLTPSRLIQLYESGNTFPSTLRLMIVGGEAMSENLYQRLKQEPFETLNVYGPTETTIWSTRLRLAESDRLSIGKPLPGETVYILDEYLNLLPPGIPGKMYIGGSGVGTGYLNRPELNRERFIQDPFHPGHRLYDTGDYGMWLPDGHIRFKGRDDDQVKIRGHRIELKEIEHCLLQQDGVYAAVVVAREAGSGTKELIAYLVARHSDPSRVREQLAQALPYYMHPSFIVFIEKMPLTPSGKADKGRLPDPEHAAERQAIYAAPRTAAECALAEACSEILKQDKISIRENFFNLGGDSIKSVRLVARLKQKGYLLTVAHILHTPVLEELAGCMKIAGADAVSKTDAVHMQYYRSRLEWAVFSNFSFIGREQANLVVIHEGTGEIAGYRHLFNGLRDAFNIWTFAFDMVVPAPVDVTPQQMVIAYADEIDRLFTAGQPVYLAGWSYGGYIAYLTANELESRYRKVEGLIMMDTSDYVHREYGGDDQKEYFTEDYRLSVAQERRLVQDLCPDMDLSDIPETTHVGTFWRHVQEKAMTKSYPFRIPAFWNGYFRQHYPDLDFLSVIEKINHLRTVGLHIPGPHRTPLHHTPVHYVRASRSKPAYAASWKALTRAPFRESVVEGGHGSIMQPPGVNHIINLIKEQA